jgi:hypothetical protein
MLAMTDVLIPDPRYALIEIKRDGLPSTVTVNEALAGFKGRDAFMWLLLVELALPAFDDDGLPSRNGAKRLHTAENRALDALRRKLTHEGSLNVLHVASVAATGKRATYVYVRDPFIASGVLGDLDKSFDIIDWTYDSKLDRGWTKVAFAFELLRGARRS